MSKQLTIIIPTRNRAGVLKTTLEALCNVRRDNLDVELVFVDNGSTDATPQVLREFTSRLPLRILEEPRPGKCHALNLALGKVDLGGIVVFSDDDVTPDAGWLQTIFAACQRWPHHSVFGGRIDAEWPRGLALPPWVRQGQVQQMAFSVHRLGSREGEYPKGVEPFGPNFWVRRSALEGLRFFEGIGPHPTRGTLGDETHFLRLLRARGFAPVHVPQATVKHRIEAERITRTAIYRRSFQFGRGCVHTQGMPEQEARSGSRATWHLRLALNVAMGSLSAAVAALEPNEERRFTKLVSELSTLGKNAEALRCSLRGEPSAAERCGIAIPGNYALEPAE